MSRTPSLWAINSSHLSIIVIRNVGGNKSLIQIELMHSGCIHVLDVYHKVALLNKYVPIFFNEPIWCVVEKE